MSTFEDIRRQWQQQLQELYPSGEPGRDSREINALFRFTLEDVFGVYTADQFAQRHTQQLPHVTEKLEDILRRLLTGEPLQYITGFTYFDDLKVRVSPDVLIPRPETEELIYLIAESAGTDFSGTIVDWCTGSGCIALALKNRYPKAMVIGYDWSEEALDVARLNAAELQLDVAFERKDGLRPEPDPQPVTIIVSNPPYIPEKDKAGMRTNVLDYEPHMALFVADDDALLFYKALTAKAIAQLGPGGMLFFELHEDYAEQTKRMVEQTNAFGEVTVHQDLQGKPRMLRAVKQA